ncbi:hypothetical protein KBC31_04680 [Candidatus Saccharibacteria bacterium]|jgi:hypothetical protein|nr:hypothetical protein [Candidatus Saccharibacteria bacterium]
MNQQFSKAQVWQIIGATTISAGIYKIIEMAVQAYVVVQSQLEQYDQLKEQLGKEAEKPQINEILVQSKIYYLLGAALVTILIGLIILVIIKRNSDKNTGVKKVTTSAVAEKKVETITTVAKKSAAKKTATKKPAVKKTTTKKTTKK